MDTISQKCLLEYTKSIRRCKLTRMWSNLLFLSNWLMLCTLGLSIVNLYWCRISVGFVTIFNFGTYFLKSYSIHLWPMLGQVKRKWKDNTYYGSAPLHLKFYGWNFPLLISPVSAHSHRTNANAKINFSMVFEFFALISFAGCSWSE